MAHLDLSEQEQIAKIRYFWKDWGKYLLVILILLILGYIASSLYSWHQKSQAQKASAVYLSFTDALSAKESVTAYKYTQQLMTDLPGTEYAQMAVLQAAKLAFEQKDYTNAEKYLIWAKDNAKDPSMQTMAILRLANVYLDEKKFDAARKLLLTKHDLAFDGLFYEARGDMYLATGETAKARDAYKEGLQKAANDPSTQQSIQMKLDILGG